MVRLSNWRTAIMKTSILEQRLFDVYRMALTQKNWMVAEHLLTAIEAMDSDKPPFEQTTLESAYLELARATQQGGAAADA